MAWLINWNRRKQLSINGTSSNIVPDNSLAANDPFWALPSGSFSRNTTSGHSDTYSIQGTSLTPQGYATNKIAISSTTLTISGWVYTTGNTNRFGINTYDSAGNLLHSSDTWNVGGSSSASWTYLSSTFTVESNATQVALRFVTGEGSPTSGIAYWDDLSIVPTQTNYQMRIIIYKGTGTDSPGVVYCGGNIANDFSDLRFTASDGSTLLNYFISSYTSGISAVAWVQIPSMPSTGTTNIFIYYNSVSPVSTTSNGSTAFDFFDDFNSLTNWSTVSGSPSVSGSIMTLPPYAIIKRTTTNLRPITILALSKVTGIVTNAYWIAPLSFANSRDYLTKFITVNGTQFVDSFDGADASASTTPFADNTYHELQIKVAAGQDAKFYTDGANTAELTSHIYSGINDIWFINHNNGSSGQTLYVDWVAIRKYSDPEPSWRTASTEQSITLNITSIPTGAEILLRYPSGTGSYVDQQTKTNTTIYVDTAGSYDIKLILGGYQDWYLLNQSFSLGQQYIIQASLTILPGTLSIFSAPSGAEIYINNVDQGVTTSPSGATISEPPGTYNITLKLTGYQDWTGSYNVVTNSTTSVSATFAGSANIASTPSGGTLYLDGSPTPIGNTPLTITNLTPATSDGSVPTQTHTYVLKLTGYADTSGSFIATAGQTIYIPVTFPGSLNITSIPTGAQIYIDGILQ